MPDYDFTSCLSPLDFEILSKDLLQEELGLTLEIFSEGRDKGIDLRYAQVGEKSLIVQCKRYGSDAYSQLKSKLKNEELPKIKKLNPSRYILATSVSLSVGQVDELAALLSPFIKSSGDIYGRERLNSLLAKFPEVERRTLKLWISSTGVLEKLLNADLHAVSENELARVQDTAKLYVKNTSFDEALKILKEQHVCIIAGIPGIGKTTLARMLLLYFYNAGYEIIKIESNIREAHAAAYHKKPRFYYYDDFLGQTALPDKLSKNEDQNLVDFITAIRESRNSKLVLTTREYILNQARRTYEKVGREPFDHETYILDLAKYTRRNKAQILYNHLFFSELPLEYAKAIQTARGYIKIVDHPNFNPRLIEFMTAKARTKDVPPSGYLALCIDYLKDPKALWTHAFEQQLSRAASNLLLILTTLPTEVASEDLTTAFSMFHSAQAKKYGVASGPQDYMEALKELDGTFISTRRDASIVLIRFQNPSVRDFMQNYLLESDYITDILSSCTRFEQPRWFCATLTDGGSKLPQRKLAENAIAVKQILKSLFRAPSCFMKIDDYGIRLMVDKQPEPKLPNRLEFLLHALGDSTDNADRQFLLKEIKELAYLFEFGEVTLNECLPILEAIRPIGLDLTSEGQFLLEAVKTYSTEVSNTLQDFNSLADLVADYPDFLAADKVSALGRKYESFAKKYAEDVIAGKIDNSNDPDEIRVLADTILDLGNTFAVDAGSACELLKEYAKEQEIEQDTNRDWDDNERRNGAIEEACSDSELDSMFATLNGE